MRSMRSATVMALAAGTVAASVAVAPAASAQTGQLTLGIYRHQTGTTKTVTLTCEPTGGTHPDAALACADLIAAGGEISLIPPTGAACPTLWDPVTAAAFGTWNGRFVSYSKDFTNAGCANVTTGGHVFHF